MKMWDGRFKKELNPKVNDFNSSIKFDGRMYQEDIIGSIAHIKMLGKMGVVTIDEMNTIIDALKCISDDIESGKLLFDETAEDIHMFIESVLTERIGDTGKKLHTARSRNDQVALDIRLYLRKECKKIKDLLYNLLKVISDISEQNIDVIMPGYTHLQHAQPILFSHHVLAYAEMFKRDIGRLNDTKKRFCGMPLGSCALAGTTYTTDRHYTAELLGFPEVSENSIDGVSDRDFCIELVSALSIIMVHLSRFSEEIILWCTSEFDFIELDDSYSTGSSIMPQKKNPDIAELTRGKSGRVFGALITLLTVMKSLPLAYNKDMQEDKEAVFDSVDTVKLCLTTFADMLATIKIKENNMLDAAQIGFLNATDCADYLVRKGLPFREAYKIVGVIVSLCIEKGYKLETLPINEYKSVSQYFDGDIYEYVDLKYCVNERNSYGGTSKKSVEFQIKKLKEYISCSEQES